jgi:hypothetical protein
VSAQTGRPPRRALWANPAACACSMNGGRSPAGRLPQAMTYRTRWRACCSVIPLLHPRRPTPVCHSTGQLAQVRRCRPALARWGGSGGLNRPRRGRDPVPGRVRPMPSPGGHTTRPDRRRRQGRSSSAAARRPSATAPGPWAACGGSSLTPGRAGWSRGHGSGVPPAAPRPGAERRHQPAHGGVEDRPGSQAGGSPDRRQQLLDRTRVARLRFFALVVRSTERAAHPPGGSERA